MQFRDSDHYQTRLRIINSTIEEFTTGLPHDQPISAPIAGEIREAIDYVFQNAHSLEDMLRTLEEIASSGAETSIREWATKTRKTILSKSPTSLYVTIEQLRAGRRWTIKQAFQNEYNLAAAFMRHPDFIAGVTSLLIDKPKTTPKWNPGSISKTTLDAARGMFTSHQEDLPLLKQGQNASYHDYPHSWTALPSERDIEAYLAENNASNHAAVFKHFAEVSNHKLGVKEKIEEVLRRMTSTDDTGKVTWKYQ